MLIDRIIGAFTFRKGVYAEVEEDATFTTTAWIIVALVAFLNQVGSYASGDLAGWLIGAVVGTIFTVIGFAVGALVINWVGRALYSADVTFHELVRTLGLAYVWNVIGVLGVLGLLGEGTACVLGLVMFIAWISTVIAWFRTVREALDLTTGKTLITVLLAGLAMLAIALIAGLVLWLLGVGILALSQSFAAGAQ
jgi:hypothetical protein